MAHDAISPLSHGIGAAGQLVWVNSLLHDRMNCPPPVGAGRPLLPWVQAAALPVRAPISPANALALELF